MPSFRFSNAVVTSGVWAEHRLAGFKPIPAMALYDGTADRALTASFLTKASLGSRINYRDITADIADVLESGGVQTMREVRSIAIFDPRGHTCSKIDKRYRNISALADVAESDLFERRKFMHVYVAQRKIYCHQMFNIGGEMCEFEDISANISILKRHIINFCKQIKRSGCFDILSISYEVSFHKFTNNNIEVYLAYPHCHIIAEKHNNSNTIRNTLSKITKIASRNCIKFWYEEIISINDAIEYCHKAYGHKDNNDPSVELLDLPDKLIVEYAKQINGLKRYQFGESILMWLDQFSARQSAYFSVQRFDKSGLSEVALDLPPRRSMNRKRDIHDFDRWPTQYRDAAKAKLLEWAINHVDEIDVSQRLGLAPVEKDGAVQNVVDSAELGLRTMRQATEPGVVFDDADATKLVVKAVVKSRIERGGYCCPDEDEQDAPDEPKVREYPDIVVKLNGLRVIVANPTGRSLTEVLKIDYNCRACHSHEKRKSIYNATVLPAFRLESVFEVRVQSTTARVTKNWFGEVVLVDRATEILRRTIAARKRAFHLSQKQQGPISQIGTSTRTFLPSPSRPQAPSKPLPPPQRPPSYQPPVEEDEK